MVADSRTVMPPAYKLMIIESRPPGPALPPWATRRGVNEPALSLGTTGLEGAHLRGRRSWPHSRFVVLGRAGGADSPLSQFQVIG